MQRHLLRAMLLAFAALMLGAVTTTAQEPFDEDQGSVLVGVRNDVALAAGDQADAVIVIEGSALIEGATRGIVMIDADVTIQGAGASVDGIFAVGGTLTIGPGATVDQVGYVDTTIVGGERVTGEIRDIETDVTGAVFWIVAALAVFVFFIWIGGLIATLVAGLLMVAFGTWQARRAAWTIGSDPLKVLAAGLLAFILPWIVFALLLVTLVGIPLALGLMLMWLVVVFLGYLVVGLWIGERILSRSRNAARPYGAVFLGVLILLLLSWIPFVSAIAGWVGLGAVTLAGWRVLRGRGGGPPVPYGYGTPYPSYGQPAQVPPPWAPPPYAPPPPSSAPGQWPPQGGPPANWPG